MPKFSDASKLKLNTCSPLLRTLFNTVIENYDCQILEGHRGQEAQDKAFAEGKSKLKWPHGKHNSLPSKAVDVAPFPIDWKDTKRFYHFSGYVQGIASSLGIKLRWGGAWNDNDDGDIGDFNTPGQLSDLVHFELLE